MAHKDTNKKIHKDAINRDKIDPKYGYVSGEWHEGGSHHFRYENAEEPEKFFEQKVDAAGNYKHTAFDDKDKAHVGQLHVGEVRNYTGGGVSHQIDSHYDLNGELTGRMEILHDMGRAVGGDYHDAVKGHRKVITKSGEARGQAGSSLTIKHKMNNSTEASHFKGDYHHYSEKNHNVYVGGNSHVQYSEHEDTRYTGGNYDRYVDKQYHVFSKDAYTANTDSTFTTFAKKDMSHSTDKKFSAFSKEDMSIKTDAKQSLTAKSDITITSDSKITLKVGSSTITIESGKISIKSSQVDINGSPVKINGGGVSVPPFTVS